MNNNIQQYLDKYIQLDHLINKGLGESEEAEKIRDEADIFWRNSSEDEIVEIRRRVVEYVVSKGNINASINT